MISLERNADSHQIRFYHRGEFELQTELGPLAVKPGDFVVIPSGMMFREFPKTKDNAILIFETRAPIRPAEELWDSVGSPDEIASVEKLYHISAAMMRGDNGSSHYSVDHSAVLYLIAPDGDFITALKADQTGTDLATAIRKHFSAD